VAAPVGTAVLKFERGEMKLALFRNEHDFIWCRGREPFGRPLATTAAAIQFLRYLCDLYNYTLDLALPPPDGKQAEEGSGAPGGESTPWSHEAEVSLLSGLCPPNRDTRTHFLNEGAYHFQVCFSLRRVRR